MKAYIVNGPDAADILSDLLKSEKRAKSLESAIQSLIDDWESGILLNTMDARIERLKKLLEET